MPCPLLPKLPTDWPCSRPQDSPLRTQGYVATILTTREPIQEHITFMYHKIHDQTRRTVKSGSSGDGVLVLPQICGVTVRGGEQNLHTQGAVTDVTSL